MLLSTDDRGIAHTTTHYPSELLPSGERRWHKHGVLHRSCNRPAVVRPDGYAEWWIDGRFIRSGKVRADKRRAIPQRITLRPPEAPLASSNIKQAVLDMKKQALYVIVPRQVPYFLREAWFKIYRLLRLEGLGASEAEAAAHAYIDKPKPRGTWQAHCRHYLKKE